MAENPKISIAVVGGGMTGISAAMALAKTGHFDVTLFEKENHLGGLSDGYSWNGVTCDRYYHVVLSTDTDMLDVIEEIGLTEQLYWTEAKSGFYGKEKLVSMSTTLDFVRFPFLSLWQKFRLAIGILYSARLKESDKLDRIYARQWLTTVFGRRVYEKIWQPLLRSKLGDAGEKTSASFIWATIKRLYGARSAEHKQEKMGHVYGGYRTILTAAEKRLKELGVTIYTDTPVTRVATTRSTQSTRPPISLVTHNEYHEVDKVLLTVDCPTVLSMVADRDGHPYWQRLADIRYLGVVCVLLILSRKLSPYYVTNLLDDHLPFTGIIEYTNILPPPFFDHKHLVYLPKYALPDDPVVSQSDEEVFTLFFNKLKTVHPSLDDSDLVHYEVFRSKYVQPLQELNFFSKMPTMSTPIDHLHLANTSMMANTTLNNNAAVGLGRRAARHLQKQKGIGTP